MFVVSPEGLVYPVDKKTLKLKKALTVHWPESIKNYRLWDKQLLELRDDKIIYHTNSGKVFPALDLSEEILDFVTVPIYDSF